MHIFTCILSEQKSGVNQTFEDQLNSGLTGCYVRPSRGCYKELTKASSSSMQPKKTPHMSPARVKLIEGAILYILIQVILLIFHGHLFNFPNRQKSWGKEQWLNWC